MKIDLSGKTASVTGSTAGIGYAIAKGLAQAGADVVVNSRTVAAVERAGATLTSEVLQANIRGVAADVGIADGYVALMAARHWWLHRHRPTFWSITSASTALRISSKYRTLNGHASSK